MEIWMERISLALVALLFLMACKQNETVGYQNIPATVQQEKKVPVPEGKRVAFGWETTGMLPGDTILLTVDGKLKGKHNWLRLTVAQEIWDKKLIHAFIPGTTIQLGTFDIKYSSVLVPYEIAIPRQYIPQVNKQGISLVLEGKSPFWFFSKTTEKSTGLVPHILSADQPTGDIHDFLNCFLSANSVQSFGWREGTVLDGLWQIYSRTGNTKALKAINEHLRLFFDDNKLVYESAGSRPNDNHVDGIESTIPFATLARLHPNHPILQTVVKGWDELEKENGMVIDGTMVSAEGCYTVSYPMTVIGKAWNDKQLMADALEQLKHRFVLIKDGNFYLRYYTEGRYTYRNWARGAAWFLLGFSRTIEELGVENVDEEIISKFKEAVDIALSMQRTDGLWSCFMHEQDSFPDTSGSAGIAAAVITGLKLGILPGIVSGIG